MSFPTEKFKVFTETLQKNLQTYLQSNVCFFHLIGIEQYELETIYIESFRCQFEEYMNEEIVEKLRFAGKNISCALYAYMRLHPNMFVQDLYDFAECLVCSQLENFVLDYEIPEWCDENYEDAYIRKESAKTTRKLFADSTNQ